MSRSLSGICVTLLAPPKNVCSIVLYKIIGLLASVQISSHPDKDLSNRFERVNVFFKECFRLNNVRYQTRKRAKVHSDLATLVYNASKLVVNHVNSLLN